MTLENPNYIEDLNSAAPLFTDFRSEGDDHIRNIKKALKNTFPGLGGRAWRVEPRSVSSAIVAADNFKILNCAAVTLTPAAASILGNGFLCLIRANGGTVTVNPNENINGQGQMIVPNGYTGLLFCDGSEFYLLMLYQDVPPAAPGAFPAGTRMSFQQTSAPVTWTKVTATAYNDAVPRITTGTVGTGGSDLFSVVFAAGRVTGGHSLTSAENGPHAHTGGRDGSAGGVGPGWGADPTSVLSNQVNTGSSGSGTAHTHPLTMNPKYADFIIATKD